MWLLMSRVRRCCTVTAIQSLCNSEFHPCRTVVLQSTTPYYEVLEWTTRYYSITPYSTTYYSVRQSKWQCCSTPTGHFSTEQPSRCKTHRDQLATGNWLLATGCLLLLLPLLQLATCYCSWVLLATGYWYCYWLGTATRYCYCCWLLLLATATATCCRGGQRFKVFQLIFLSLL